MPYKYLDKIEGPAEIKRLAEEELLHLATEIRQEIIDVVYKNGGHLGSNLGVVDLTLALHYVFDSDKDVFIWDGSYQTYTHKLLTGRKEKFRTLRQFGGLSGFGSRTESVYDPFSFGHIGTALATAYGMCVGDEKLNKKRRIIAIVGDGAMTSGIAFEGLNNIAASKKDILIILNDNGFSIAKTVGAISKYLSELRTAPLYGELKKDIYQILNKIPLGHSVEHVLDSVRRGLIQTLFPNIFTAFGMQYYGPIDGHDLKLLIKVLTNVKHIRGPKLLHVITQKGKGHPDAGQDPFALHKPYEPKPTFQKIFPKESKIEPKSQMQPRSYTKSFVNALVKLSQKDNRVCAITAAMPDGTGVLDYAKYFPERAFDVGISEQCAIAFAAGLANAGLRPVCAIYSTFLQRAFDQIFQEVCLQDLPVLFAIDRAGIAGEDGPTHHGVFDIGFLRLFPNIVLMAPKDEPEFHEMIEFALNLNHPSAIRCPREDVPDLLNYDLKHNPIQLGKGELLVDGKDGAILAYGVMVKYALMARDLLLDEGIKIAVANARFAKPIDCELVAELVDRFPFVLTCEDHTYQAGFGAAVLEAAIIRGLDTNKFKLLAIPDKFIEQGHRPELLHELALDEGGIAHACKLLCKDPKSEAIFMNRLVS